MSRKRERRKPAVQRAMASPPPAVPWMPAPWPRVRDRTAGKLGVADVAIVAAALAALAGCDEAGRALTVAPAEAGTAGVTLTLGPATDAGAKAAADGGAGESLTAALDPAGRFTLTRGGATLLASPVGVPLLSRTADPASPQGWHDPTRPAPGLPVHAVDVGTVQLGSEDDGSTTRALHLVVGPQPADTALLTLTLALDGSSFLTGLGEQFTHVSARGRVAPMFLTLSGATESGTNDAHVPVPFLVSSDGWGLFVASREAGAFDVAATEPGQLRVTFEGRTLDAWLFIDPDPLALVARFNRLAGLPRPLPRWALSPIHWRHWSSVDDVLNIAREYRRRHIPSSALWFDDGWQTGFNTFTLSPSVFEDVPGMMAELAALGFRTMAWSTPYLEKPSSGGAGAGGAPTDDAPRLYETAAANRWFVEDGTGQTYVSPATPIKGGAGIVDFTSPGARDFWGSLVGRATASGLQGFKCDYGEELIPNLLGARNPVLFSDGTTARTARLYPLQEHAAYHAALDRAFPGDGLLIARASSWGGASEADVIWPGDLDSAFQHRGDPLPGGTAAVGGLPAAVVAAQTLAVSGFPAFGSDTAGYRGSPSPESLVRWMEHTALSVVMQVYEDGPDRLPWAVSDTVATQFQALASLHQALLPYNATLMRAAQLTGVPPLRPLPLAFPGDPAGWAHADDEYLLGPDLLVAPVTTAGVATRTVHLPPGRWVHFWTDQPATGPVDLLVPAPLGQPPLFARAGGIVPMLPPGIDTVGSASEPGVTTLSQHATEMTARAWASGQSTVTLDDGGRIDVADDVDATGGIRVTWTPGASITRLTLDVDARVRSGGAGPVSSVITLAGSPVLAAASAEAVQQSSGSAWAIAGGHATLRLVGATSVRLQ